MADNITLNAGAGGSVLATDDISGTHYQLIKLGYGALDSFEIVSLTAGLPIQPATGEVFDVDVGAMPDDTFVAEGGDLGKGVLLQGDDGTDRQNVTVDTDGHVQVDIQSLPASTNTLEVVGDVAEDAAAAGNPVLIAGRYDATPRALDDNDAGALALTPEGAAMAAVAAQTDFAYDVHTKCTIKRVSFACNTNGNNEIIAAVAGKKFRLLAISLLATSTTAVNTYFKTEDDAAALLGSTDAKITLDQDGIDGAAGLVLPLNAGGWCETSTANKALQLVLDAAVYVTGTVTYIEVD